MELCKKMDGPSEVNLNFYPKNVQLCRKEKQISTSNIIEQQKSTSCTGGDKHITLNDSGALKEIMHECLTILQTIKVFYSCIKGIRVVCMIIYFGS